MFLLLLHTPPPPPLLSIRFVEKTLAIHFRDKDGHIVRGVVYCGMDIVHVDCSSSLLASSSGYEKIRTIQLDDCLKDKHLRSRPEIDQQINGMHHEPESLPPPTPGRTIEEMLPNDSEMDGVWSDSGHSSGSSPLIIDEGSPPFNGIEVEPTDFVAVIHDKNVFRANKGVRKKKEMRRIESRPVLVTTSQEAINRYPVENGLPDVTTMCHSLRFWLAVQFFKAGFNQVRVSEHFGITVRSVTRAIAENKTLATCDFVSPAECSDRSWKKLVHDYGTKGCKTFYSVQKRKVYRNI